MKTKNEQNTKSFCLTFLEIDSVFLSEDTSLDLCQPENASVKLFEKIINII